MSRELTFSIIKPNAVKKHVIGSILAQIESQGLTVVASKMKWLGKVEAEGFYEEHRGKPFFNDLVEFMTSGPVIVQVLKGEDAISRYRDIMGPTDPKNAPEGTIRALYADSMRENAVHGSDSPESAQREIDYFFARSEVFA